MNTPYLPQGSGSGTRGLVLTTLTLCLMLAAGSLGVSAAVDPATPISNKSPIGGGGGSGDDGVGGSGGGPRKVALGVAIEDGTDMAYLDGHTADAGGNRPAYWILRTPWGGESPDFPSSAANQLRARGVTPIIWWTPLDPSNPNSPRYSRHKNVAAGNHDAYIRSYARDAKAFGDEVILRFAHEVNSDFFPWSADNHDNNPATFKDMWRHVHDIFVQEGATNVRWLWSLAKERCAGGCNPFTVYYPGHAYVDVMGFSAYNWGVDRSWVSMWQTFKRPMINLMAISGKPIIAAETGSNQFGGSKPAWIRNGYNAVYDAWPQLTGIVWTDVDLRSVGHPDWRIASPPGALDAYREIASLPRFKSRTLFSSAKLSARVGDGDGATKKKRKSAAATRPKKRKSAPRVVTGLRNDRGVLRLQLGRLEPKQDDETQQEVTRQAPRGRR